MKEAVKARARELGFDDCRITSPAPPESAGALRKWLEDGMQGEMGWLQRNAAKRADPSLVLPGARSIVLVAASYHANVSGEALPGRARSPSVPSLPSSGGALWPKDPVDSECFTKSRGAFGESTLPSARGAFGKSALPSTRGVIARYAMHADYHDVLADRLKQLSDFINSLGGGDARSLWYTDTGPVLERDLGQRAGLGFAGKHTNLISRTLGNWFLIGEILTTVELEPDQPERNRCGSCARCISACPTAAIRAPFTLDARRCISYLTIELKGAIPEELRPLIGNRIFGCDDCLDACPWNKFAREGALMRAHRRDDLQTAELLELVALDDARFKARFAGTPIARSKRRGLLRNVCVALGNVAGVETLPALERAANDAEPLIAEHARWAIERIRSGAEGNPGRMGGMRRND